MFKRIVYLGYYIKELDWPRFKKFSNFVSKESGVPRAKLIANSLYASLKYNISLSEYFLFRFYEISNDQKKEYAGTGYMYEYQRLMNPKPARFILEDKLRFLNEYRDFVKHNYVALSDFSNVKKVENVLKNKTGKIVLKDSAGQCGNGIEVRNVSDFDKETLQKRLEETGNDFVEDFVEQHKRLNELSPSGLNTVRIITQLDINNNVEILGARLRITVNSSVDNMAAGNLAASIDIEKGIVNGVGVYSDITKPSEDIHPVTNNKIIGFEVPFWKESVDLVTEAALLHKENRSVGWDVAITNYGPELIEGNHDWCKLLWQLPVQRGLKPILEKHKQEYLKSK